MAAQFKVSKLLVLYSFIHAIVVLCHRPQPVDIWFRNLKKHPVPKSRVIEVYVQDVFGGPRRTVYEIARASITSTSSTSFGQLLIIDDLLTLGPDPNSPAIGRLQGLAGYADLNTVALYLSVNFFFTEGPYNGSTISVLGRNQIFDNTRELSIVGGTGVFRLARGIAKTTTNTNINATDYGVLKYTLYVTYI